MLRNMYQGGSSKKQGPRLAMRDADEEPPWYIFLNIFLPQGTISPSSFVRGALSKEIENGSKMSLDSGLSWIFVFVGGRRSVWVQE